MERWRQFFRSAGVDLWTVCERALAIAYMDNPDDFPSQRDRLAQKLFAPEKFDLQAREDDAPRSGECRGADVTRKSEASSDEEHGIDTPNGNYDEAEALTEEMEEESILKREVLRIKDTLLDSYQSEREIFDSLQRLELMQLSFDVLKETEIGKTVNSLRKHTSGRVRSLAKRLVSEWKDTVEHWYKSVEDVAAAATEGIMPTDSPADEEDGLPSPPMDEGALMAARNASLEMSQLFDFMDDETSAGSGNPNSQVDNSLPVSSKNSTWVDDTHDLQPSTKHPRHQNSSGRKKNEVDASKKKDRASVTSSNGHSKRESDVRINGYDTGREYIQNGERKVKRETIEEGLESQSIRRTETLKLSCNAPLSVSPQLDQKLLASKRKLQENYQQAENAKRQRTIQVMELQDLPKGGPKRAKAAPIVRGKPGSQHQLQGCGR